MKQNPCYTTGYSWKTVICYKNLSLCYIHKPLPVEIVLCYSFRVMQCNHTCCNKTAFVFKFGLSDCSLSPCFSEVANRQSLMEGDTSSAHLEVSCFPMCEYKVMITWLQVWHMKLSRDHHLSGYPPPTCAPCDVNFEFATGPVVFRDIRCILSHLSYPFSTMLCDDPVV
jgi:hypothetical protein